MPTIGEILSEARRARKKTIKEVESITNIRSRYISALETNKFDIIPGHIYVKGFIRTYAEYLGIDYTPLIETYKKEYEEVYENKQMNSGKTTLYHEKAKYGRFFIAIIAIIVVIIIVFLWWNYSRRASVDENEPKIITETKKETEIKKEEPSKEIQEDFKTKEDTESANKGKSTGPITIEAEVVNQRTYLEVTVDDTLVYANVLESGQSEEWQGIDEIKIRAAHADAVKVYKNGEDLGFMGQSGGVIERVFKVDDSGVD